MSKQRLAIAWSAGHCKAFRRLFWEKKVLMIKKKVRISYFFGKTSANTPPLETVWIVPQDKKFSSPLTLHKTFYRFQSATTIDS